MNDAIGRTNLHRKAENQEEEETDMGLTDKSVRQLLLTGLTVESVRQFCLTGYELIILIYFELTIN